MRIAAAVLLALALSGCASPAALKIQAGKDAGDRGDLVAAEALTREGLRLQPDHETRAIGINNLGHFAALRGDRDAAIQAFTLAARMGYPLAQQNLLAFQAPIPAADLAPQAPAASGGGADAALLLFLAAQQGGTCTHRTIGDTGYTKC